MMRTVIGSNVALRYLKAYQAHVNYWHELNPAVMLGYVDKKDHTPYLQDYAAAFSDSLVVLRIRHELDGGFHLAPTGKDDHREYVASPLDYHNDYGFLGQIPNGILNVMNEPAGDADDVTIYRLVRWITEYIPIAAKSKTKSLLFNWADRNPKIVDGMMDGRFDTVLTMMAHYPDLFYMGMHFYGPDLIADHLKAYVDRCEKLSIKPPKVIGSEFGLDSTGSKETGYKTRPEYSNGTNYAKWQIAQVKGDLAPYFASGVLVGLTTFQEGNSGGWQDFDIENDSAYKSELKRAAMAGELDMQHSEAPTLPVYKKDIVFGNTYQLSMPGKIITAYIAPSISDRRIGTIPDRAEVVVLDVLPINGEKWIKVKYKAFSVDVFIQGDLVGMRQTVTVPAVKIVPEVPAVKPDEPPVSAADSVKPSTSTNDETPQIGLKTPKTGYIPTPAQITILESWRSELAASIAASNERLAIIDNLLASIKV